MSDNERQILESFKQMYKKLHGHTYSLVIVKNVYDENYNFFIENVRGATWSNALGSVPFDDLDEYKSVLKKLLASGLPVEYRGFDN
ncbi:hypothetical protein PSR33_02065 [Latilactobacillus curvatus]|uniref:Uncharacterized protein n=1 Tax=Latilactobacillus curvatus TaxID=28038 RepID=A0AAJ5RIB8_LATCU|nr:hypothetical protein [Latilactobacillus curvatus]WDC92358.1 hypothetical protein PSR33_02065 [Latilactobacillus curvatus]